MPTAVELLVEVLALDATIHRTYPSTAVCWGGVGGNMITVDNPFDLERGFGQKT